MRDYRFAEVSRTMGLFLAFGFLGFGFEGGDVGTLYGGEGADLVFAVFDYGFG